MPRGKHGASSSITTQGRRSFLERRAVSEPGIKAAKAALNARQAAADKNLDSNFPGTFELLYQSKDGKLRLYQTGDGHLSSVDGSKLA